MTYTTKKIQYLVEMTTAAHNNKKKLTFMLARKCPVTRIGVKVKNQKENGGGTKFQYPWEHGGGVPAR